MIVIWIFNNIYNDLGNIKVTNKVYSIINDLWVQVNLSQNSNTLLIGHTVGRGTVGSGYYIYLLCAGDNKTNEGDYFKISGSLDFDNTHWADGLTFNFHVPSTIWMSVSILCLY